MPEILPSFVAGTWRQGSGAGAVLRDPVLGTQLARVNATGLDLHAAFAFARQAGGQALRALTYRERAALLAAAVKVLQAHRDEYFEIAMANSGTVKADSGIDIDGAIYTLGQYAKWGEALGDARLIADGEAARLGKDPAFQSLHVQVPARGVALLINAFNFPAWGLWEKAAPALLSGVPVIVKPATCTALLAQRMVRDVVDARVFPVGAISMVCGSADGLLDALGPFDLVSFTGSAETAHLIRSHPAVAQRSARANIEADSVNSALLMPGAAPGSEAFDLLVREVAREMTAKSGQKCTAIRRVFVPDTIYGAAAEAIAAKLARAVVGNPRNERVTMGSLVSRSQRAHVEEGLEKLKRGAAVLHDGAAMALVDADAAVAACVAPTLLGVRDPASARDVHTTEVFGPVATLMPYRGLDEAHELIRRGEGSLVASLYGDDHAALARAAAELADSHGRVHVISPDVAQLHTGHGNVMPQSMHGGPGRAGGGEELGGLRALNFYHRRSAIQASRGVLDALVPPKGAA